MSYQALYRKYRPKTFKDVYGQEHITETLKNELAQGTTVHAYLFTGTRGTGKTTCAKILANAVNCTDLKDGNPCLECESCRSFLSGENTDIVEIDAASNNGVDDIRILREQIAFAPASSKYRVYIIDEVHMLSINAFNALLKTLEEPPSHVIFILATTEVHKLPATILSRCQRFDFRRIDSEKICERLQFIAKEEGLSLTDEAATLIASAADGGMRDALSILDLCASGNQNIDEATVENVCAMAGSDYLLELADFIKQKDTESALLMLDKLHNSSVDMLRLLSELISHYRDLMIIKTVKKGSRPIVCSTKRLEALENQAKDYDIKDIIFTLNCLQSSTALMQSGNRRCEMEMAVIKLCNPEISVDIAALERRISALENGNIRPVKKSVASTPKPVVETSVLEEPDEIPLPEPPEESEEIATPEKEPTAPSTDGIAKVDNWNEILDILKTTCPLIAGVLGESSAYIKGDYLLIDAKNSQFRTLIKTANGLYKDHIRKAAEQVLGATYKLGPYSAEKQAKAKDPLLSLADKLKNLDINQ
ncbi:MAG: DNA polymerase III subunit gamma/tau [Clostridia bacterium]|nr:DNA polymerase III subunit gamma/tau [Clostridia bacterium]